jgi:hypothetical protein
MNSARPYPSAIDHELIGTYPAVAKAGGGYVWDAVLEYRVWCHSEEGDFYYAFAEYEEALAVSNKTESAEEPLALVLQREYIDEPEEGEYIHVKQERVAEWPPEFLQRPKRTDTTIPDFLSPNAPSNRLDILRGKAK